MGYTYNAEDGKIKIMKGALVVIMAMIKYGLYQMVGETIIKDQVESFIA